MTESPRGSLRCSGCPAESKVLTGRPATPHSSAILACPAPSRPALGPYRTTALSIALLASAAGTRPPQRARLNTATPLSSTAKQSKQSHFLPSLHAKCGRHGARRPSAGALPPAARTASRGVSSAAAPAVLTSIRGVSHHLRNPYSLPISLARLASPSGQCSPALRQAMTGQTLPAVSVDRPFPRTSLHLVHVGPAVVSAHSWGLPPW